MDELEAAVNIFYRSQNTEQAQLNEYLISQQKSPLAWQWCWDLISLEKSVEISFFASTTLHQKIIKNWQEVPAEMHNELKEKILQKIITFGGNGGTKLVLNRLCMSVS